MECHILAYICFHYFCNVTMDVQTIENLNIWYSGIFFSMILWFMHLYLSQTLKICLSCLYVHMTQQKDYQFGRKLWQSGPKGFKGFLLPLLAAAAALTAVISFIEKKPNQQAGLQRVPHTVSLRHSPPTPFPLAHLSVKTSWSRVMY